MPSHPESVERPDSDRGRRRTMRVAVWQCEVIVLTVLVTVEVGNPHCPNAGRHGCHSGPQAKEFQSRDAFALSAPSRTRGGRDHAAFKFLEGGPLPAFASSEKKLTHVYRPEKTRWLGVAWRN